MSEDKQKKAQEILDRMLNDGETYTSAQIHQALKEQAGIEEPTERTKIIETFKPTPKQPDQPKPAQPAQQIDPGMLPALRDARARALNFLNPGLLDTMGKVAKMWIDSGALPTSIKNVAQLVMVLQAGYEAGLQPLESIGAFYIVNGKITMYGDQVIAQVLKAGHTINWGECNAETATVEIVRGDGKGKFKQTVTFKQYEKAGVTSKGPWVGYPDRMLKYKAFASVAHFIAPDALRGIAIKEDVEVELGEQKETVKIERPLSAALAEGKKENV